MKNADSPSEFCILLNSYYVFENKVKKPSPKIVTDNSKIVIIHSSIVCSTSGEAPAIPRTTITGNEGI